MAKHDVALEELRRVLNTLTEESKIAADRRVWFGNKIRHYEEQGYAPEHKYIKEFSDMDEKVKSNFVKIQSIIASIDLLEAEDAKETYMIEMSAEDSTIAVMELTPSEVALIERMIEQFDDTVVGYAPSMSIKKYKREGQA